MLSPFCSPWALVPALLLVAAAAAALYLLDRPTLLRTARALLQPAVLLLAIGAYAWAVYHLHHWAADIVLSLLLTTAVATLQPYGQGRWTVLTAASVAATAVAVGVLVVALGALPARLVLVAVTPLMALHVSTATAVALTVYDASLRATHQHRLYLMANGATRQEALMPSARRALRAALLRRLRGRHGVALVALMPVVLAALLMGGYAPLAAVATTLLLALTAMAAAVAAALLALVLLNIMANRMGHVGAGPVPARTT